MLVSCVQEELKVLLDEVSMGQERSAYPKTHTLNQTGGGGGGGGEARSSGAGAAEEDFEGMGAEEFQESNHEVERIQSLLERVQATRVKGPAAAVRAS